MYDVYCGPVPTPETLIASWTLDIPSLVLCAAILAAFIALHPSNRHLVLGCGLALFVLLFISPLCALTGALFSARAAHHIVLVTIVAPLLALAFPASASVQHPYARRLSIGLIAALHACVFWFWHAPPIYAVAIVDPLAYWAMQLTLLGSAFWLWRRVVDLKQEAGGALLALLGTMVQMGLLGALLTFAATPLYEPHFLTTIPFGLAPVQDQQLAGLIMWVPAALPYLVAAIWRVWPLLGPSVRGSTWFG